MTGSSTSLSTPKPSAQFVEQVRSMPFEPHLHLVALSCWHLLWAGNEKAAARPQNRKSTALWRESAKFLGLDAKDFRLAVDERLAPEVRKRFGLERGNPVALVADVLPALPEPVLRLALERISTTPGFADNAGVFIGEFREVWRETESLALNRNRGSVRAPVGLVRLVGEALNFRHNETLYVPHAEDGFAAAELYGRSGEHAQTVWAVSNPTNGVIAASRFKHLCGGDILQIQVADSWLSKPLEGGADVIYCDGPWGGKVAPDLLQSSVPIPTTDTELLQIQHAILSLRPGGRAAIVMPQSFAFRKGARSVREWLLKNYRLDAVVELRSGTMRPYANMASILLFVRRLPPVESVLFLPYSLHKTDLGNRIAESSSESLLTTVLQARLCTETPTGIENQLRKWEGDQELSVTDSQLVNLAKYLHLVGDEVDRSFPELVPVADIVCRNAELLLKESRGESLDALLGDLVAALKDVRIAQLGQVAEVLGGAVYNAHHFLGPESVRSRGFGDAVGLVRVSDFPRFTPGDSDVRPLRTVNRHIEYNPIAEKNQARLLRPDDVLLSIGGTIGRVCVFDKELAHPSLAANGLAIVRAPDSLTSNFLAKLFTSEPYQRWFTGVSTGSTIQHLQLTHLRHLSVPVLKRADLHTIATELEPGASEARVRAVFTRKRDLPELASRLLESRSVSLFAGLTPDELERANGMDLLKSACDEIAGWELLASHKEDALCERLNLLQRLGTGLLDALALPETGDRFAVLQEWRAFAIDRERDLRRIRNELVHSQGADKRRVVETMLAQRTEGFVANLLRLAQTAMQRQIRDVRITATIMPAILTVGKLTEVKFSVRSDGSLPVRKFKATTSGFVSASTTPLLPADGSHIWSLVFTPQEAGRHSVSLAWNAERLDGEAVSGRIELAVEVQSPGSVTEGDALGESPYVYARVLDEQSDAVFFGRANALSRLEATLRKHGATTILLVEGNRRIGKTSLLGYFVRHRLPDGWVPVFINFQDFDGDSGPRARPGIPTCKVFEGMAREVAAAVAAALPGEELPGLSTPPPRTSLAFGRWLRTVAETIEADAPFASFKDLFLRLRERVRPKRLVLFLDEFDRLQEGIESGITSDQVPENLRHLFQSCGDMAGIFTGSRTIRRLRQEYWNVLFGLGETVRLGGLEPAEAAALIEQPVQGRLVYSPEAVRAISELTTRQPLLIQGICDRLFQLCRERGERGVTLAMVEGVAAERASDSEHFETLWGYIKSDRQRLLTFLVDQIDRRTADPMRLTEPDVIARDPAGGTMTLIEFKYSEFKHSGVTFESIQDAAEQSGVRFTARELDAALEDLLDLEVLGKVQRDGTARYHLEVPLFGQWLRLNKDFNQYQRAAQEED